MPASKAIAANLFGGFLQSATHSRELVDSTVINRAAGGPLYRSCIGDSPEEGFLLTAIEVRSILIQTVKEGNRVELFFGDLHAHASVSPCYWKDCPECGPDDFFHYARVVSGLDFVALTDHDHGLTEGTWKAVQEAVRRHYDPGRFVTFLGYEWTNNRFGHQNVYFSDDHGPLIRARGTDGEFIKPTQLWEQWEAQGVEAISVPHHTGVSQFPADWTFHHPHYQPVSEVTSLWGNFVTFLSPSQTRISNLLPGRFVSEALEDGYRLGFVGGSDSHDCRPGNPTFGGRTKPNIIEGQVMGQNVLAPPNVSHLGDDTCNTRGLTAVWASELTRPALWDAIRRKHTYATTGARIAVRVTMADAFAGDRVTAGQPPLTVDIIGTYLLQDVTVVANNRPIHRVSPDSDRVSFSYNLPADLPSGFVYVHVRQRDGHEAWTSPFWLDHQSSVFRAEQTSPARPVEDMVVEPVSSRHALTEDRDKDGPSVCVDVERTGSAHYVLRMTVEGGDWADDIAGELSIQGASRVRCRDFGLVTRKYGGDLYTVSEDHELVQFRFPAHLARIEAPGLELLLRGKAGQHLSVQLGATSPSTLSFRTRNYRGDGLRILLPALDRPSDEDVLLPWPDRQRLESQ